MRVYVAVITALVALSALASGHQDKHERLLHKWLKVKAMEGCFGEENVKHWIVKMKKAKAECENKPAVELHLPIFKKKVRVSNALLAGPSGLTHGQEAFIDAKMRQQFVARLMAQEIGDMSLDEATPYFVNKYSVNKRVSRQAEAEEDAEDTADLYDENDLAGMMVQKLTDLQNDATYEISNITCVMQTLGYIDDDKKIVVKALGDCLDEGKFKASETADGKDRTWLQGKMHQVHQMCYDLAEALPESVLEACSLPDWLTKLKTFHKCAKKAKINACMNSDMRQKIAGKGLDIAQLTKDAGLGSEEELTKLMAMLFFKH